MAAARITQAGVATIKVVAGPTLEKTSGDGYFQTVDISIRDKDGRSLLEIVAYCKDDMPTQVELALHGARSGCKIPAANPATPDKEDECAS